MTQLTVIKIGGNIIDDENRLDRFLLDFAAIGGAKILVHGGGKLATKLAEKLEVPQQLVEGRRITDEATLDIVTMVYAGKINKTIVAKLQAQNCAAIGICGADGDAIRAHKRTGATDFGFVGDIDEVNVPFLAMLLNAGYTPVCAPITHDRNGGLLNTNADTIAQELATALSASFNVRLIFSFEKKGVLADGSDDNSVIPEMAAARFEELKAAGVVSGGMIPKLENAFSALEAGVGEIVIGRAEDLPDLLRSKKGTRIIHD